MRDSIFSLTTNFSKATIQYNDKNMLIKVVSVKEDSVCANSGEMGKVYEAFNDNVKKEVNNAGKIFCETLNGKLARFPEKNDQFKQLYDYMEQLIESKGINSATTPLVAKSFSLLPLKPDIGIPEEGYLDIFDTATDDLIKPDKTILDLIRRESTSYQSKEELCYLIKVLGKNETHLSQSSTKASIFTDLCSQFVDGWTLCEFRKSVTLRLKGLCSISPIDRVLSLLGPDNSDRGRPGTFVGITGWTLDFSELKNTWNLHHPSYKKNTVTLLDTRRRPFGKNIWVVENYECNFEQAETMDLQISSCEEDQFTCNDGMCIDFASRCDRKNNCVDISDEKNCRIVSLDPQRYLKDDPPTKDGRKANVTLSMVIKNILDIKEVQQRLSLKFRLEAKWLDGRLSFFNLKMDEEMNKLLSKERNMIWVPRILFSNTKEDLTSRNDEQSFAKVVRNPAINGSLIAAEVNEDIMVYEGKNNEIKVNRVYDVDLICTYAMEYYPFDIQTCTVDMVIHGNTAKFVNLLPGSINYTGRADFSQYFVMGVTIYSADIVDKRGVKVSIQLGRQLLGTILTVYVPTILLNIIGHATNYYKDFFFEAVVSVNLTCMLVLVTMFISVANSLPKTSYLKMMDYWLIGNLILPFLEVVVHTYMEMQDDDDSKFHDMNHQDDTKKNDPGSLTPKQRKHLFLKRMGKVYTPTSALTFVAVYWFVGLRNAQII